MPDLYSVTLDPCLVEASERHAHNYIYFLGSWLNADRCSFSLLARMAERASLLCVLRTFEFRQTDAIYGYLKTVTANIVHDHFKAAHALKRGSGSAEQGHEADLEQVADTKEPRVSAWSVTCSSSRSTGV